MYLSKEGYFTLIKSAFSNLSTYFLSLFPIPIAVVNRLGMIQREFLWDRLGEERKLHLVNWGIVCSPITLRGLGLKSLVLFNKALLDSSCGDLEWRRRDS